MLLLPLVYGVAGDAVKEGSTAEENGVVRGVVSAAEIITLPSKLKLSEG